ncbi:MAG: hypothetical protein AUH81_10385 [Candidatus Rokubacteria bacterium 13_1_40CM_4_69_5]|nr:MAG: hypothetical protein AUH81_10385 [Candidatus Rokubacteria bacterium 13_1_40CM_4_69_5]
MATAPATETRISALACTTGSFTKRAISWVRYRQHQLAPRPDGERVGELSLDRARLLHRHGPLGELRLALDGEQDAVARLEVPIGETRVDGGRVRRRIGCRARLLQALRHALQRHSCRL